LPLSQEFFAGIPEGQEFLYLLRISPDSSGFLVVRDRCERLPAQKRKRLLIPFASRQAMANRR